MGTIHQHGFTLWGSQRGSIRHGRRPDSLCSTYGDFQRQVLHAERCALSLHERLRHGTLSRPLCTCRTLCNYRIAYDQDTKFFQGSFLRLGTWHKYRKEMMHGGEEMTTGSIVVQMTIVDKYKTQYDIERSIEQSKRIEN